MEIYNEMIFMTNDVWHMVSTCTFMAHTVHGDSL